MCAPQLLLAAMLSIHSRASMPTSENTGMRSRYLGVFGLLLCAALPAQGAFLVISQSAIFKPDTGMVTFNVEFNQSPDFDTVDQFNRQSNSFQYYVIGDPTLPYPMLFDSIIRGPEISPEGLPIR